MDLLIIGALSNKLLKNMRSIFQIITCGTLIASSVIANILTDKLN
jgi:hypothetical protein